MKRLLVMCSTALVCVSYVRSAQPPPDQTNDVPVVAPTWLVNVPTNDTPPDLTAPDAPLSLSSDSPTASPPLASELAAPAPNSTPDDIAPDPDPDAPPPNSEEPAVVPDCNPDNLSTNQGAQTLGMGTAASPPLQLSLPPAPSDQITETARALDCNWAQCYLFVRNQIKFTPCKGIQRGPLRTLLDREGNDADQAFLLLALLQASGYTNSTVYYTPATNGGFRVCLGGSAAGYDACSWLGVTQDNVSRSYSGVSRILQAAKIITEGQNSGTFATSVISVEHFWVHLSINGQEYDLDPSFKPRHITACRDVLADMGYSRTNLLALAGGSTDGCSVQGLNTASLAGELRRLSVNLATAWRISRTNEPVSAFIGSDDIVPQDLSSDSSTFHGVVAGPAIDFVAQPDAYKNSLRYAVDLVHLQKGQDNSTAKARLSFWLDEVADRTLWYQYTQAGLAYLMLEGNPIKCELGGSYPSLPYLDRIVITVHHPFGGSNTQTNPVWRNNGYINSIAVGFGGDHADGMRKLVQTKIETLVKLSDSIPAAAFELARLQQLVGQQWLGQSAICRSFMNRLDDRDRHHFYDIGIAALTSHPYVDFRNSYSYANTNSSAFDAYMLFASALEHSVLEQVNGTNHPAVSTVRLLDLANAGSQRIYFATSNNWASVSNSLSGYDNTVLATLATDITGGHKALLPENGQTVFNNWTGYGYIDYAANGNLIDTRMAIGGPGIGGGYTSCESQPQPSDAIGQYGYALLGETKPQKPYDRLDMLSGAYLFDRTDLSISTPMPLRFIAHYDSRLRYVDSPLGRGWAHNYDVHVGVHSDPDAMLGRGTPDACVASVVATVVASDLIAAGENAKTFTTAGLVAKWWTDQLVEGAATIHFGGQVQSFTRRPDGSYSPAPGVTSILTGGNDAPFVLRERLGRVFEFDGNRNLVCITDPSGNSTRLFYDSQNALSTVSNSFGAMLTFTLSPDHHLIRGVCDSAGRSVSYAYDSSDRMTQVQDAENFTWQCSYNSDYALKTQTDPVNVTSVQNTYNALGQVTNQVAANGQRHVYGFASGALSWERDPYGRRTVYSFTDEGLLAKRVEFDGTTNSFFYDGQGQLVTNIDALGRATVRVYDGSNDLLRITEAASTTNSLETRLVYDGQGHLIELSDPAGNLTLMSYDDRNLLLSRVAPDGTVVTNRYDGRGLLISSQTRDARGYLLSETTKSYGSLGLVTNVAVTDAGAVAYMYDKAGNVTNAVDALGRKTAFAYDARGLLTSTTDPAGHTSSRTYTHAGRLATSMDALTRETRSSWSRGGKLAATVHPDGGVSTNFFDMDDRLVGARDVRGVRVTLSLDPMGRATNRYTSTWITTTWYDPVGCATTKVDAIGGRIDLSYDEPLLSKTAPILPGDLLIC